MNPVYNSHVLMLYILLDKTNTNKFSFYEFVFDLIVKDFESKVLTKSLSFKQPVHFFERLLYMCYQFAFCLQPISWRISIICAALGGLYALHLYNTMKNQELSKTLSKQLIFVYLLEVHVSICSFWLARSHYMYLFL